MATYEYINNSVSEYDEESRRIQEEAAMNAAILAKMERDMVSLSRATRAMSEVGKSFSDIARSGRALLDEIRGDDVEAPDFFKHASSPRARIARPPNLFED
jgi:hypothetical protein